MTHLIGKKKLMMLIPVMLCITLLVTSITILNAHAAQINEQNPNLTLVTLNSDAEQVVNGKPLYTPTSTLTQQDGKYNLKTNAYVVWQYDDDVAFAYKKYNVGEQGDDYLEATVTIDSIPTGSATDLHHNASAGLMLRSGLQTNAAEVFIHVRGASILAVYRSKDEGKTSVQYTDVNISFPLQLKMVKKGNTVKLSYKSANGDWFDFRYPIGMNASGPLYVGLASHSCDQANFINANFSNLTLKGIATYDGSTNTSSTTSDVVSEYIEDDSPVTSDIVLRETFSDGNLINTPETPINPVWDEQKEVNILNSNGNRVWFKNFIDSINYVGNTQWTDYIVSADVQFTANCNPDPESASNTVKLFARHTDVDFYGNSDYSAVVSLGYVISIYKRCYENDEGDTDGYLIKSVSLKDFYQNINYNCLGDGKYHNLAFKVFDNKLTVYWDNQQVLYAEDTGLSSKNIGDKVFSTGKVGLATFETSVYFDNITVKKLEDTFGGDYDNKIGGNWDSPIPDYITAWKAKGY